MLIMKTLLLRDGVFELAGEFTRKGEKKGAGWWCNKRLADDLSNVCANCTYQVE